MTDDEQHPASLSALDEARVRLREIMQTAHDAFVGIDATGVIIDWNRRAEEIFGYSRREAMGRRLADTIVPPAYREAHLRGLARFLETGQGRIVYQRVELPALRADGEEFPAEITIWPTRVGTSYRFNAFIRDVTGRRLRERHMALIKRVAVAANEATTVETVIQTALTEICELTEWPVGHAYVVAGDDDRLVPSGIWHRASTDGFQSLVEVTETMAFEPGQGLPGRVFTSRRAHWIPDITTDRNFPRALETRIEARAAFAFPVRIGIDVVAVLEFFSATAAEPDGQLLDLMDSVGTQLGRVFERVAAAEQLEMANRSLRIANEAKDRFISVVSHEMRTPLAAIQGFATLLETMNEDAAGEAAEYARSIDNHARRLIRLVNDMLTSVHLEHDDISIRPEVFEARALIIEALDDLALSDVAIRTTQPVHVHADRGHVTRIIENYLSNAFQHGRPPVRVEVTIADSGRDAEIRVCDAGDGVDDDVAAELFAPYVRASAEGSGLGLSIVRGLARANGGEAWHEPVDDAGTTPSSGTCFAVRLPLAARP